MVSNSDNKKVEHVLDPLQLSSVNQKTNQLFYNCRFWSQCFVLLMKCNSKKNDLFL